MLASFELFKPKNGVQFLAFPIFSIRVTTFNQKIEQPLLKGLNVGVTTPSVTQQPGRSETTSAGSVLFCRLLVNVFCCILDADTLCNGLTYKKGTQEIKIWIWKPKDNFG